MIDKFIEKNEIFSVGWIAFVRKNLKVDPHERLSNILKLLIYIKENYNDISDCFSGYAQPEDVERSMEVDFNRHFAKPVSLTHWKWYLKM